MSLVLSSLPEEMHDLVMTGAVAWISKTLMREARCLRGFGGEIKSHQNYKVCHHHGLCLSHITAFISLTFLLPTLDLTYLKISNLRAHIFCLFRVSKVKMDQLMCRDPSSAV
jgi:hypothetical protein